VARLPSELDAVALREPAQMVAVDGHVGAVPVGVGLATPGRVALAVVGAAERFVVPDDVGELDVVALGEPEGEPERGAQLPLVVQDLLVAGADVFDSDGRVVEAYGVSTSWSGGLVGRSSRRC
jgi:DNA/RNA endonuclease YhcR with UshA esterase domain